MRTLLVTTTGLLLLACLAGCATTNGQNKTTQSKENITIDNGILCVSYNLKDGTFSVRRGENVFIKQARFQQTASANPTKARAKRVKNELGSGKAIEVIFPSGYTYTLALYRNLPFVCIKSNIHNPTNDKIVINKMVPVSLDVDLGKPAKDLRVLGCDGLTTAEKNRTSYTFLAMAEPETRRGIVAGWLTHNRASGIVLSKPIQSSVLIEARSEYGNLLIEPGENIDGETFAVGYFDDSLVGLEEYAGAIAKNYKI